MKRLWTPWRMPFLKAPKNSEQNSCFFCEKIRADPSRDRDNLVLVRGKCTFMLMNLYPYSNGHLLVAPYQHVGDLESLEPDTLKEMMLLVTQGIRALKSISNPHGFNIGANLGQAAGAGVKDHVHFHIVPRWSGDSNFMPVLADTRLIPELLPQTYDDLLTALRQHTDSKAG